MDNWKSVTHLLEAHPSFPSIRPYLSEESREPLYKRVFIVPPSASAMDGLLHSILDDIERMEREWGLK
jgi:hypothetical protein